MGGEFSGEFSGASGRVNHIGRTALGRTNALSDVLPPLGFVFSFFFLFGVIILGAVVVLSSGPASLVLGSVLVFGAG